MDYELLGEWGRDTEVPVYGLVSRAKPRRITLNRFGPEYGNLLWQISATYEDERRPPVTVHTIVRRRALSDTGVSWAETGTREAKAIVAAELRVIIEIRDIADRPWQSSHLPIDGTILAAQQLRGSHGEGWVVDLERVAIGLVGLAPAMDRVGRIHPVPGKS